MSQTIAVLHQTRTKLTKWHERANKLCLRFCKPFVWKKLKLWPNITSRVFVMPPNYELQHGTNITHYSKVKTAISVISRLHVVLKLVENSTLAVNKT